MQTQNGVALALFIAAQAISAPVVAATYDFIGTKAEWPIDGEWDPIVGAYDPDDGLSREQLDFVGDDTDPAGYRYDDGQYVYFRMRLDVGTIIPSGGQATFSDSHLVLIDVPGRQYDPDANGGSGGLVDGVDDYPDYALAWDSKSNDPRKHGLEMMVRDTTDNVWNGINMQDLDGQSGQKGDNDINGGGRTTDGYVRGIDQIATVSFGTTTFLDFAVSWAYLVTYTDLRQGQDWNVAFATIANATNATNGNNINADVSGGASPSSLTQDGWVLVPGQVPLPATLWLLLVGLGVLAAQRLGGRVGELPGCPTKGAAESLSTWRVQGGVPGVGSSNPRPRRIGRAARHQGADAGFYSGLLATAAGSAVASPTAKCFS
jgi:hypothetical protein